MPQIIPPIQPEAIPVVFHFVEPVVADRDAGGLGRDAELKGLKHGPKTGIRAGLYHLELAEGTAPPLGRG
jgi:hypothetical protein